MTSAHPRAPRAPPDTLRLCCLGSADLRAVGGGELRAVLRQPKRLLLLVYLTLARPRGPHRRDLLIALFWPERDDGHARNALSQALRFLRRAAGPGVVRNRGNAEVGVDRERLWCDALAFEAALGAGRHSRALELYRGDLLSGFHVSGAPELERWLQEERTRLRRRAAVAAGGLAERCEAEGDQMAAVRWAIRQSELVPYDEVALCRVARLLDRIGNRAGAVRTYEAFARRLKEDLDLIPAPETRALIQRIRAR